MVLQIILLTKKKKITVRAKYQEGLSMLMLSGFLLQNFLYYSITDSTQI